MKMIRKMMVQLTWQPLPPQLLLPDAMTPAKALIPTAVKQLPWPTRPTISLSAIASVAKKRRIATHGPHDPPTATAPRAQTDGTTPTNTMRPSPVTDGIASPPPTQDGMKKVVDRSQI